MDELKAIFNKKTHAGTLIMSTRRAVKKFGTLTHGRFPLHCLLILGKTVFCFFIRTKVVSCNEQDVSDFRNTQEESIDNFKTSVACRLNENLFN